MDVQVFALKTSELIFRARSRNSSRIFCESRDAAELSLAGEAPDSLFSLAGSPEAPLCLLSLAGVVVTGAAFLLVDPQGRQSAIGCDNGRPRQSLLHT